MTGTPGRGRDLGRGQLATLDMKHRVAALRAEGKDVVSVLWDRYTRAAVCGEGFNYEYAEHIEEQGAVPVGCL